MGTTYIATGVARHYGGVRALDGVDFTIHDGEVHALLGANGAGKSTLMKILAGAEQPSAGRLELDGEQVAFANVTEAAASGVCIVSQELNLFDHLTVADNLFLPRAPRRRGLLDRQDMREQAEPVMRSVGLDVALDRRVGDLRLGEKQLVEIARAMLGRPRILVLDEPTSALGGAETQRLLTVLRSLRDEGVGILYVSHFLEDVRALADVVTVLRNGRIVTSRAPKDSLTVRSMVEAMLGAAARDTRTKRPDREGALRGEALQLDEVRVRGRLEGVTLTARGGEVVGLAGLEGAGPDAVFEAVFGLIKPDSGSVSLPGGASTPRTVAGAVRAGVALVPADRKQLGVHLQQSIEENVASVAAGPLRRMGIAPSRRERRSRASTWGERLSIRMGSTADPLWTLSGGNQQKVVFAKWLEGNPRVVLLDDPTRGVDVGSKPQVHQIVDEISADGRVVLIRSSDLDELATICDRVLVFFGGRITGELGRADLSEHRLLEAVNTGVV